MPSKVCYIAATICLVFAAFAFHPFGSFDFGWFGVALVALGLAL